MLNAVVLKLASDLLENTFVGGQLRLGAAGGAPGRRRERRPRGDLRDERRRHVHRARRPANRPPPGWRGPNRRSRDHLPRDRRARAPGAPARDAGRERTQHGPLDRRRHARADRVGDRPLVPDRSEPGGDPARAPTTTSRRSAGWTRRAPRSRRAPLPPTVRASRPSAPPASACSSTAARAAATCSRARPRRSSSPSAAWRPRSTRTPATARSSPTASTSRERSSCSSGR